MAARRVQMILVGEGTESFSVRNPDSSPGAYLKISNALLGGYGVGYVKTPINHLLCLLLM